MNLSLGLKSVVALSAPVSNASKFRIQRSMPLRSPVIETSHIYRTVYQFKPQQSCTSGSVLESAAVVELPNLGEYKTVGNGDAGGL